MRGIHKSWFRRLGSRMEKVSFSRILELGGLCRVLDCGGLERDGVLEPS